MPAILTLDVATEPAARRVVLRLSHAGGPFIGAHEVDLTRHAAADWHGLFDTRRHVRSLERVTTAAVRLAELGRFLGEHVLGPEIARALADGVDHRTLLVRLPGDPEDRLAAAFARVPWEIARAPGDDRTLASRNVVVRAALEGAEPAREASIVVGPSEPVRVLLVFAEAPGQRPLAARLERERLLALFFDEVMPARNVEVDVLCHGVTRGRLEAQVQARGGYHLVHWSGHGDVNALEIGLDAGEEARRVAPRITGEELVRIFVSAGGFIPPVVFLGACHSGSMVSVKDWESLRASLGEDGGVRGGGDPTLDRVLEEQPGFAGTALALVRAGVKQVVAMRYEVGDTYARRLATRVYRGMFADRAHHAVDAAVALARGELVREEKRAGEYSAVDHATPLVFGSEPVRLVPAKRKSVQVERRLPRPQPLLPGGSRELDTPRGFVGRGEELTELARRWLPSVRPYQDRVEQPLIVAGIATEAVDTTAARTGLSGGAIDEHGNPITVTVQTVGSMNADAQAALRHANILCSMGRSLGLVLPAGPIQFEAGQVFFEAGHPAEVRLLLLCRDGNSWHRWRRTATSAGVEHEGGPMFALAANAPPDQLVLSEADRGRCHITAVATGDGMVLVFDLRENARISAEAVDARIRQRDEVRDQQSRLVAPGSSTSTPGTHAPQSAMREEAPVALIQGPTGLGKTSLAAEAIHLWFDEFDHVVCFRGEGEPLPIEDFYQRLDQRLLHASNSYRDRCQEDTMARIYLTPESLPSSEEREQALRNNIVNALRAERILLVFDDFEANLLTRVDGYGSLDPAWDRLFEAFGDALRSSYSRVLVTSRRRLAALANPQRAIWIPLGPLPIDASFQKLAAQWPTWAWLPDILQRAGLAPASARELPTTDALSSWVILAKPSEQLQQHFELQSEVLVLCAPGTVIQADIIKRMETIFDENPPIDSGFALVITADPGAERRLSSVLPDDRRYLFILAKTFQNAADPQAFVHNLLRDGLARRRLFDMRSPASDGQFFGREKELEGLERDVMTGQCVGVFGLRKVGKTSLLGRLAAKLRGGTTGIRRVLPVEIDLLDTGISNPNLDGMAQLIGWALDRELSRVELQVPGSPSHPLERLRAAVEHIERAHRARILLIMDEYEVLLGARRVPPSDGIELLTWLRGLAQEHPRGFSFMLAGRNPRLLAPARIGGADNPMYRFLRSVPLTGLLPDDCRRMVQKLGGYMGLRFERDALEVFVQETGGHPALARTLGDLVDVNVPTEERNPAIVDVALMKRVLPRFSRVVDEDMREFVNAANDIDARAADYLAHLAHSVPWIGGQIEARIDDALVDYGILHPETHAFRIGRLLTWLQENYGSPAEAAHG